MRGGKYLYYAQIKLSENKGQRGNKVDPDKTTQLAGSPFQFLQASLGTIKGSVGNEVSATSMTP